MIRPTIREIATDRELWKKYIDPEGVIVDAFDALSIEDKMHLQVDLWPLKVSSDDVDAMRIINESHGN